MRLLDYLTMGSPLPVQRRRSGRASADDGVENKVVFLVVEEIVSFFAVHQVVVEFSSF